MFSKQKPDSKVRFQNRLFKQRLQEARNYRRTPSKLPDKKWEVYCCKVGLASWPTRIMAILAIFAGIYVLYIPNPLYVKKINILGLKTGDQQALQNIIYSFLKSKPVWPQQNLLLLSKSNLSNHLLANQQNIYKVISIKKQWPDTLNLELEPRTVKYAALIQDKTFIISNDGNIMTEASSSTPAIALPKVKFLKASAPQIEEKYLNGELIASLDDLNKQLPKILNTPDISFELDDPQSLDINTYTTAGLKIIFDVKSNTEDTLRRLQLLLSNVSDSDKQRLQYIDMRFEKRGYICFKNTSCARDIVIQNSATSTASSTPLQ